MLWQAAMRSQDARPGTGRGIFDAIMGRIRNLTAVSRADIIERHMSGYTGMRLIFPGKGFSPAEQDIRVCIRSGTQNSPF